MPDAANFSGSIPAYSHEHIGDVMFEPYAEDLVRRVPSREDLRVLEIACSTGIVTRLICPPNPGPGL